MISEFFKRIYTGCLTGLVFMWTTVSAETPPNEPDFSKGAVRGAVRNLDKKNLGDLVADTILFFTQYVTTFLLGLIILLFLWGLTKYLFKGQNSDTARAEGRKFMLWGVLGIFVITSWMALVAILASVLGHQGVFIPQF